MTDVYALLVGIDTYRAVSGLRGCRGDATAALAYLRSRTTGDSLHAVELYDDKATREAVIDGIRHHLGRAGAGDTAVFFYAGHGSQAPVPPELWHTESTAMMQTLVCTDSRDGDVPDLYDKELAVLLDAVAARGGHVVAILDSCHAAGAVREVPEPDARARKVPPVTRAPLPESLIPELRSGWRTVPDHSRLVELAACHSDQLAHEMPVGAGEPRGVFTWALLRALDQLGPAATYREVLAAARCAVEDRVQMQAPQLAGDEPADQPFLGGALTSPASGITLRHLAARWEIDAGSCHGLPPVSAGPMRVAVAGDGPARAAEVVSVLADRSIVAPQGWSPDPDRQYPVIFTRLAQPPLAVAAAPEFAGLISDSPYLLVAGDQAVPDLRIDVRGPGRARISGTDGQPLTPLLHGPAQAVRAAEHIARWRHARALGNPVSPLAGAVHLEIVPAYPGERTAPLHRPALAAGADGRIRLAYRRTAGGWVAPTVFARLRNTSDRNLWCVLLDLTSGYRIHTALFPGAFVGAGRSGAALNGRPVQFSLPRGREPLPGRDTTDWLKLIVAECEFSGRPFEQPPLDEAGRRGVLERIRMTRDAGAADPDDAYDWAATTVAVHTVVP